MSYYTTNNIPNTNNNHSNYQQYPFYSFDTSFHNPHMNSHMNSYASYSIPSHEMISSTVTSNSTVLPMNNNTIVATNIQTSTLNNTHRIHSHDELNFLLDDFPFFEHEDINPEESEVSLQPIIPQDSFTERKTSTQEQTQRLTEYFFPNSTNQQETKMNSPDQTSTKKRSYSEITPSDVSTSSVSIASETTLLKRSMSPLTWESSSQDENSSQEIANKLLQKQHDYRLNSFNVLTDVFNLDDDIHLFHMIHRYCANNLQFTITLSPMRKISTSTPNMIFAYYYLAHEIYPDGMFKILERRIHHHNTQNNTIAIEYIYKFSGTRIFNYLLCDIYEQLIFNVTPSYHITQGQFTSPLTGSLPGSQPRSVSNTPYFYSYDELLTTTLQTIHQCIHTSEGNNLPTTTNKMASIICSAVLTFDLNDNMIQKFDLELLAVR